MRKLRCRTSAWQRPPRLLKRRRFPSPAASTCRHSRTERRDRLSRRRRGRPDRPGARLRLQQGGELGACRAGSRRCTRDGRRVIALDNRGHGQSTKLYDPADYHTDMMADDVAALIEHLGLAARRRDGLFARRAHQRGARRAPSRARALADPRRRRHPAGRQSRGLRDESRDALEAPSIADVTDPMGKAFRAVRRADQIRPARACRLPARLAPAACAREDLAGIRAPTLVAVGTKDDIAGSPHELAALMPNGRGLDIPDRDHMVAVGDSVYKAGVHRQFLQERP